MVQICGQTGETPARQLKSCAPPLRHGRKAQSSTKMNSTRLNGGLPAIEVHQPGSWIHPIARFGAKRRRLLEAARLHFVERSGNRDRSSNPAITTWSSVQAATSIHDQEWIKRRQSGGRRQLPQTCRSSSTIHRFLVTQYRSRRRSAAASGPEPQPVPNAKRPRPLTERPGPDCYETTGPLLNRA